MLFAIYAQLQHNKYAKIQQAQIWAGLSINFCSDLTLWYKSVPVSAFLVQFCLENNLKNFQRNKYSKNPKIRILQKNALKSQFKFMLMRRKIYGIQDSKIPGI